MADATQLEGRMMRRKLSLISGAKVTVTGPAVKVPQVNSATNSEANCTVIDLSAPDIFDVASDILPPRVRRLNVTSPSSPE
jgi:hypothetical protein